MRKFHEFEKWSEWFLFIGLILFFSSTLSAILYWQLIELNSDYNFFDITSLIYNPWIIVIYFISILFLLLIIDIIGFGMYKNINNREEEITRADPIYCYLTHVQRFAYLIGLFIFILYPYSLLLSKIVLKTAAIIDDLATFSTLIPLGITIILILTGHLKDKVKEKNDIINQKQSKLRNLNLEDELTQIKELTKIELNNLKNLVIKNQLDNHLYNQEIYKHIKNHLEAIESNQNLEKKAKITEGKNRLRYNRRRKN